MKYAIFDFLLILLRLCLLFDDDFSHLQMWERSRVEMRPLQVFFCYHFNFATLCIEMSMGLLDLQLTKYVLVVRAKKLQLEI